MTFTDQTGNTVTLPGIPQRIVSLVPSQTELLCDLRLEDRIAGITKFCVHPERVFRSKPRVGGTKTVKADAVRSLRPDLVIANREENDKAQVEELARDLPVWISDVRDLDDALTMIAVVGEMTDTARAAASLITGIRNGFDALQAAGNGKMLTAAYLIWNRPVMCAGGNTFIDDMLRRCGLKNVFAGRRERYPEVTAGELRQRAPGLVLLSSEPFPFKERHVKEYEVLLPGSRVMLADGEFFSWYGSRLLKSPDYFRELTVWEGR